MQTKTYAALGLTPVSPEKADCSWCGREAELLQGAGFHPEMVEAYTTFYGIFGTIPCSLQEMRKKIGLSEEDAQLAIVEIGDWLTANSPYRSLPRRCWVCDHAQGPEDLAHLKEPVPVA
jgi:hypothetical protein